MIVTDCEPPGVAIAVRTIAGLEHRLVVARRAFARGHAVMRVHGHETATTHRHTLQVDAHRHVEAGEPAVDARGRERYPWRFVQHACDPNLMLRARVLIARREIAAGDELTLDYLASEYDMAAPFACACTHGCERIAPGPDGARWIRGYRYLSSVQREGLRDHACAHVERLAASER